MLLLVAALVGVIYISILWALTRSFLTAWIVLLAVNFLNFAFGMDSILVYGLHINSLDLLYLCIVPAGLLRLGVQKQPLTVANLLPIAYLLLFCLSLARGFATFPFTEVGNEARGLMNIVVAFAYFTTAPRDPRVVKRIVFAYIVYAIALSVVAVAHYAGLPVGGTLGVAKNLVLYGEDIDRALPAAAAATLELALLFAASWCNYRLHARWLGWICLALFPLVVILQHRTVWAMAAGTLLAAAALDRRVFRYLLRIGLLATALGILILLANADLRARLTGELRESATNANTFEWRLESWKRSVSQDQSALSILIGLPVGSGYLRIDTASGAYIDFPPHDEFINEYLRVGILGSLLVLAFVFRPIFVYFSNRQSGKLLFPTPASWILVTIGTIIFCLPYSGTFDGMALVAIANACIDAEHPLAEKMVKRSLHFVA